MTYAPDNLLAVRRLMLDNLDLDPAEVGIVGDANHIGGYHCGADRVRRVDGVIRDYSVIESPRDRSGLTDAACAVDIGQFDVEVKGKRHNLRTFSVWLVAQCKAGTPDTRDIREVIYSPDGKTVRRWDRLGKRSTGDSSHLWHTHISYHRDAIKAGRDQTPVYRRYLTEIGRLAREGVDAMTPEQESQVLKGKLTKNNALFAWLRGLANGTMPKQVDGGVDWSHMVPAPFPGLVQLGERLDRVEATLAQLAERQTPQIDYDQLAAALLRGIASRQG